MRHSGQRDLPARYAQQAGLPLREAGFSMIEMLLVVALIAIVAGVSIINIGPAMRNARVTEGHQITIMQLRRARQESIDKRRVFIVTFNTATNPHSIQIQRREQDNTLTPIVQLSLPGDIQYRVEPGVPTNVTNTPDQFGTAQSAVEFALGTGGNNNEIYFQPDGSARDNQGRINNGVVYLARPGALYSSRAVTLYGFTGRIKGWRLQNQGGIAVWN